MSIIAVCECGKKFEAKDEYEGRRAICPSCRREFVFQREGIPVFEEVIEPSPIPPDRADDDAEPEQPQAAGASRPFWKDPIIVIGAAVPSVILAMFFAYLYREYRTKEFHRHVYELKTQADFLSKTGRARLAFEKYDEVLAEIGDQSRSDAKLHGYAEVSRKLRDRLYAAVKKEVEREAVARQAQAEADRLAAKADRLAAEVKAETDRLAPFRADVTGGVWLANKLGQSSITRGLRVYVLRAHVRKSEISDLLERAKNRAILRRSATET